MLSYSAVIFACWGPNGQCDFTFLLFVKQRRSSDDLTQRDASVPVEAQSLWSLDAFSSVSPGPSVATNAVLSRNGTICFSSVLTGWFQKQTVPFFYKKWLRISHHFFCFIMSFRKTVELMKCGVKDWVLSQNVNDGQLIVKLQCVWDYGHMSFNLMSKQYDFWCKSLKPFHTSRHPDLWFGLDRLDVLQGC